MSKLQMAVSGLFLYLILCPANTPAASAMPQDEKRQESPAVQTRIVLATADLTGSDREMGKFLADTLITDLSRSKQLQPLERATVQECYAKLQFEPDRALTAGDVRKLGTASEADRVLVGSFLIHDDQLIINARMLDAHTGLVIPGGAMSVSGNKNDMLSIAHRLARQLHKRITDTDLIFEDLPPVPTGDHAAGVTEVAAVVHAAPVVDDFQVLKSQGLIPAAAHANTALTEADLGTLVKSVAKCVTPQSDSATVITPNLGAVTRIRAMAALVKLFVAPDDLANYKGAPPAHMPSDAATVPAWGVPFLAAAVDQEWWPGDRPVCAKDPATWAFVATLLTRLPLHTSPVHVDVAVAGDPAPLPDADADPYSGLVIDALDLSLERAMSPRILDEAGRVVYPDPGHVPSDDYIQDHGMVSYYGALADAKRAGKHPLVVHATHVSEIGHDDITVSNETAELIREANRRGKFLWKWNVAVLAGKAQPVAQTPPGNP